MKSQLSYISLLSLPSTKISSYAPSTQPNSNNICFVLFSHLQDNTGWGISRLTPGWGISRLTPLYPTNGLSYAPGSQYKMVGGKAYTASQVRTTSRSWDRGVLTDLCLTRVLTDLCLTRVLTDLCPTLYNNRNSRCSGEDSKHEAYLKKTWIFRNGKDGLYSVLYYIVYLWTISITVFLDVKLGASILYI